MPSIGKYNETYFRNHPKEMEKEGVLYGIILVNRKTFERECIKVGMASGKDWRHIVKRSRGFKGYDIRIQRTWTDTLYHVWIQEQYLHEIYKDDMNQKLSLGVILSVSKLTLLFFRSSLKIILDMAT